MKILLTGAGGQLGREMHRTVPEAHELIALSSTELNVTDAVQIDRALAIHEPAVVLNAAGYTAVDRAETERERAQAVNGEGPGLLAQASVARGIRLIHVSTDFVFDGKKGSPYLPDDSPNPLGVYGETKLAGERAAMAADSGVLVVRTAWLYSGHGQNFVNTMLRLMRERSSVGVVADQVGTPTWARGLARALWRAVDLPQMQGIHHWTDAGVASWYDFAVAIQEEAQAWGLLDRAIPIRPIRTQDFPTPARRPAYSVLDKTATWGELGITPPHWRVALREMIQSLAE
ncbi:MAG: dTDP-4-dehydrorhamnose reductase [Thiotrichales bacterium SG8_50]|nr:MAG: dTDP-4-dehydrorhamnose reductase [Thiotrichales bacterium SG8_50]